MLANYFTIMSHSILLKDIKEGFFQCSLCKSHFKEPKILPCLDRYCKDCLNTIIQEHLEEFACPGCKRNFVIPTDEVDGFKTDSYMKNMVNVIQVKKTIANEEIVECTTCLKKVKIAAYCFKCIGFLCGPCHELHQSSKKYNDHQPSILGPDDVNENHLTLEKLTSLTAEAPKCNIHPTELALLCCCTCSNLPTCVQCKTSNHKGHDFQDVKLVAKDERKKVDAIKVNVYKLDIRVQHARQTLQTKVAKEKAKVRASRQESDVEHVIKAIDAHENQAMDQIKEIKAISDERIKRFENFITSASCIISSNDDWTHVQYLPTIRSSSMHLGRYVETEYPELETLSDFSVNELVPLNVSTSQQKKSSTKSKPTTQEKPAITHPKPDLKQTSVNINGFAQKGWWITGLVYVGDDRFVITGRASDGYSHITIVNMKGDILRGKTIKKKSGSHYQPDRYCAALSKHEVATVCKPDEVGIFDARDVFYTQQSISELTKTWPAECIVSCVTADPSSRQIFVGTSRRYVYVFDSTLHHSHTLSLPEFAGWPRDLTYHNKSILVCSEAGRRAYAVTEDGPKVKILYRFSTPDLDGRDWRPISVCSDNNGFIYILWWAFILNKTHDVTRILVQYRPNEKAVLTTRPINETVRCFAIRNAEKLVPALESGKIVIYDKAQSNQKDHQVEDRQEESLYETIG